MVSLNLDTDHRSSVLDCLSKVDDIMTYKIDMQKYTTT